MKKILQHKIETCYLVPHSFFAEAPLESGEQLAARSADVPPFVPTTPASGPQRERERVEREKRCSLSKGVVSDSHTFAAY